MQTAQQAANDRARALKTFGFEHEGTWITNPTASDCGRMAVSPRVYGFDIVSTGGGCRAWARLLPGFDGVRILLTDLHGETLPTGYEGEPFLLGLIAEDGEQLAIWTLNVGEAYDEGEEPQNGMASAS